MHRLRYSHKFSPAATVRLGKIKGPVGLERLQSGGAITFAERAFPTELAPNRDIGVQLQGDVFDNRLNYTLGVYNGTADGRDSPTSDADNEPELAVGDIEEKDELVAILNGGHRISSLSRSCR